MEHKKDTNKILCNNNMCPYNNAGCDDGTASLEDYYCLNDFCEYHLQGGNIMEYKTDKRTKNLSLRDIHVGDWVQVWSEITERYSPPLKIIQICDDGTIYLVTSDEERPTPWEEDIKNVDALPIDADLLRGFGFEKLCDNFYYSKDGASVMAQDKQLGILDFFCIDKYGESAKLGDIAYMHELQQTLYEERNFIGSFNPEWKGVEK